MALLLLPLLAGCFGGARRDGVPSGRLDPNDIVDATPRREPITRAGNKSPYTVLGQTFHLLPTSKGYRARGTASWYGSKFHGESTANGEAYDALAMTAAHTTLPIPTYVQVTNLENGRRAIVRVNDRGPFVNNRIIDLSYAAATKLGYANKGTALVEVVAIDVDNWPPAQTRASDMPAAVAVVPAPAPAPPQPLQLPQPTVQLPAPPDDKSDVGARHYVQAGAFSSESAAENLRQRLQLITHQRVELRPTATAPILYRVRVGPLSSREQAEQVRVTIVRVAGDARVISD